MPPSLPRIDAIGNFHNLAKQQFEGCLAAILVHLTTSHRRSCLLHVQPIIEVRKLTSGTRQKTQKQTCFAKKLVK
jgi:hypothetical protein